MSMEFKVDKQAPPQHKKYEKGEIDLAYSFARTIHKEFGRFVKAVVLFGSTVRREGKAESDIDILVVVDDVTYTLTPPIVESYRVIVEEAIVKISRRIHVTTLRFTSFWEYIKIGDPVGINILRNGVALLDTGFFYPLQMLLFQGRIRPTVESVRAYFQRAKTTIFNSEWHLLQGTLNLYWAVIDAGQAALMRHGLLPPPPKEVEAKIQEHLVSKGLVHKNCPMIMKRFYELSKKILHRELKTMNGKEYDELLKQAQYFVEEMKKAIDTKNVPGMP